MTNEVIQNAVILIYGGQTKLGQRYATRILNKHIECILP